MTHVDPYLPILVKNFSFELDEQGKSICVKPIPIGEFIELIKKVEKNLNSQTSDTKRMITGIRKVYYGGPLWDIFIITDKDAKKCDSIENNIATDIKSAKIVTLMDKYCLDIGHVFAGLDALQYPRKLGVDLIPDHLIKEKSSKALSSFKNTMNFETSMDNNKEKSSEALSSFKNTMNFETSMDNNADFSTWLGDLGDLLKEKLLKHKGNLQQAIEDTTRPAAPGEDMLGNIDAYVIHKIYFDEVSNRLRKPMKLSEILDDYYIKKGFNIGTKEDRYHIFAECVGLKWDSENKTFSNESDWIERFAGQLRCAATLCIIRFGDDAKPYEKIVTGSENVVREDGAMELRAFLAGLKELM